MAPDHPHPISPLALSLPSDCPGHRICLLPGILELLGCRSIPQSAQPFVAQRQGVGCLWRWGPVCPDPGSGLTSQEGPGWLTWPQCPNLVGPSPPRPQPSAAPRRPPRGLGSQSGQRPGTGTYQGPAHGSSSSAPAGAGPVAWAPSEVPLRRPQRSSPPHFLPAHLPTSPHISTRSRSTLCCRCSCRSPRVGSRHYLVGVCSQPAPAPAA